ncbi:MAG: hypothetical protein QM488_18510 [Rhizobiaceae bacterium]
MNAQEKKKLVGLENAATAAFEDKKAADLVLSKAKGDDVQTAKDMLVEATKTFDAADTKYQDYLKVIQVREEKKSTSSNDNSGDASAVKTKAKTEPKKKAASKGKMITVTAFADRRRAGRSFAKGQPVDIPFDELGEGEFDALDNDPVLAVSE